MDSAQWFREAQFGLMIHWGLYCLPAGEWKGRRTPHIGEWLQPYFRIPNAEYHQLAKAFNPIFFHADDFAALAADAGMKYLVITAKHHEGFGLFKSKVSDFTSADGTPFHRDIIEELAAACQKRGIKLGLYYSQELDWSHPHGGGVKMGNTWMEGRSWTNDWDFPDNDRKDFSICYEEKTKPQVQELLTQYGDLCLIWFDTPGDITLAQSRELVDMVHHYQPGCLVNSRVGNNMGDYASLGDNEIPEGDSFVMKDNDRFHEHAPGRLPLYESACTLNDTWGYKSFDQNWKKPEIVIANREHLKKLGINYLLNVGPDGLGRIPGPAVDILREVGRRG